MEEYNTLGFEFEFDGNTLSDSAVITQDIILGIDKSRRNGDVIPIFVKNINNGEYMVFGNGKWYCESTGISIEESDIYKRLEKENKDQMEKFRHA